MVLRLPPMSKVAPSRSTLSSVTPSATFCPTDAVLGPAPSTMITALLGNRPTTARSTACAAGARPAKAIAIGSARATFSKVPVPRPMPIPIPSLAASACSTVLNRGRIFNSNSHETHRYFSPQPHRRPRLFFRVSGCAAHPVAHGGHRRGGGGTGRRLGLVGAVLHGRSHERERRPAVD